MEGQVVAGRFRIRRRMASGGMGVVYEAEHIETGRHIALKLMHSGGFFDTDSASWTARMRREARVAGGLDTPHVVQVLDAGESEHGSYIAMELLKGTDVRQLLKASGAVAPDVAIRIVAQACLGTSAAHARGVLHRDIKPGNLFLSIDELGGVTVKVIDFGIAKITKDPTLTRITVTGQLVGTPAYASPEQARGLSDVDERTDVWSLGVVLYRLLSGNTPRELSGNLTDYLITLCTVPAPPVTARAPWVSERLSQIVSRALEIDRDRRYPSVRALFDELASLVPDLRLTERELMSRPPPAPSTSLTPQAQVVAARPEERSSRALLIGIAVVLALALGIAAGIALGRRGPPASTDTAGASTPTQLPEAPAPGSVQEPMEPNVKQPPSAGVRVTPPARAQPPESPPLRPSESRPAAKKPPPAPSDKPKMDFETDFE